MKRPTPLAVRIPQSEKIALSEVAKMLGTNRNHLVRQACLSMVREFRYENLISKN